MGELLPIMRDLFDRRRDLDLSQRDLAARFDVPANVLGSWERGDRNPTLAATYLWARHLGLRPVLVDAGRAPVPIECCPPPPDGADVPPIVQQLRATRRVQDVSTRLLAERLGVTQAMPVMWESAARGILLLRTYQYAAALGLGLALEEARRPRPRRSTAAKTRPVEGRGTGR